MFLGRPKTRLSFVLTIISITMFIYSARDSFPKKLRRLSDTCLKSLPSVKFPTFSNGVTLAAFQQLRILAISTSTGRLFGINHNLII